MAGQKRQDEKVYPWLVVYVDTARDLALIRWKRPVIEWALDKLGEPWTWSWQMRGAVAAARVANDLPALAKLEHEFVVVSFKPPPQR